MEFEVETLARIVFAVVIIGLFYLLFFGKEN